MVFHQELTSLGKSLQSFVSANHLAGVHVALTFRFSIKLVESLCKETQIIYFPLLQAPQHTDKIFLYRIVRYAQKAHMGCRNINDFQKVGG